MRTAPRSDQQEGRALFAERERIQRLERIRQLVFGSLDGLLVPLGVISGVAEIVIVGGLSAGGGYLLGILVPQWLGF